MNPLDMMGPKLPCIVSFHASRSRCHGGVLGWSLCLPYRGPDPEDVALDPYEVAYLTGGLEVNPPMLRSRAWSRTARQ